MDWPIPHGRGTRKRSLQARDSEGWDYSPNMEWGQPQVLFQLIHYVIYEQCECLREHSFSLTRVFLMRSPNEKLFMKDVCIILCEHPGKALNRYVI